MRSQQFGPQRPRVLDSSIGASYGARVPIEQLSGWSEGTGVQKQTAHACGGAAKWRGSPCGCEVQMLWHPDALAPKSHAAPCGSSHAAERPPVRRQSGGAAPRPAACGGAAPRAAACGGDADSKKSIKVIGLSRCVGLSRRTGLRRRGASYYRAPTRPAAISPPPSMLRPPARAAA